VLTSGRKMRAFTPWQLLVTFGRIVLRGDRAMMSKEGLEFWYEAPREAHPEPGRCEPEVEQARAGVQASPTLP
jgi:hypothetical protein